jgi:hypothetical protein
MLWSGARARDNAAAAGLEVPRTAKANPPPRLPTAAWINNRTINTDTQKKNWEVVSTVLTGSGFRVRCQGPSPHRRQHLLPAPQLHTAPKKS